MKNIQILTGDITKLNVDAIVNAANSSLLGGGGVDGAIHNAGGAQILQECKKIRETILPDGLPTGEAVITTSGKLSSNYVIHTVGPIYNQCNDKCAKLLSNCYKNSIKTALEHNCQSIAFPAISTGVYGYPKQEAAKIAYESVQEFTSDINITFIFFSSDAKELFEKVNQINIS